MNELLERLQAEGPALSRAVLDEMYRDPFWRARFGDRGRKHADEDSAFHLQYLARALIAGEPQILVRYARWLREVLATRGMCSRHLAENFRLLAVVIDAQRWPDGARATAMVREARRALDYTEGDAGLLQARRERIAAAALPRVGPARREALESLLSYLEDSFAFGEEVWTSHLAWIATWLEETAGSRATLVNDLEALAGALSALELPAAAVARVRSGIQVASETRAA